MYKSFAQPWFLGVSTLKMEVDDGASDTAELLGQAAEMRMELAFLGLIFAYSIVASG